VFLFILAEIKNAAKFYLQMGVQLLLYAATFSEQVLSSVIATKCEKKLPEKKSMMEANHRYLGQYKQ